MVHQQLLLGVYQWGMIVKRMHCAVKLVMKYALGQAESPGLSQYQFCSLSGLVHQSVTQRLSSLHMLVVCCTTVTAVHQRLDFVPRTNVILSKIAWVLFTIMLASSSSLACCICHQVITSIVVLTIHSSIYASSKEFGWCCIMHATHAACVHMEVSAVQPLCPKRASAVGVISWCHQRKAVIQ
jgi:hypothetical protein